MDAFDEDGLRSICSDFLTRSTCELPRDLACDDLLRSISLKCFVSKFLLKVASLIHSQLRNDAIFQQHVQVSGELRRHLEENAAGEVFVSVAANDVEPLQSSPLADSPVASPYVTSRSLEASGTYMAPLRYDPSQSSVGDANGGLEICSAGRNSGSGEACNISQDFGQSAVAASRDVTAERVAGGSASAALASSSMQTSSVLSSAVLPQFMQSLTPLGGSANGSSKERVTDVGSNNVVSSFTSQDNGLAQAPQAQQTLLQTHHALNSSNQQALPALLADEVQGIPQDQADGLQSIDQKQSQQQKAASALAKYQEFIRQQQMPPPLLHQPVSSSNQTDSTMASISQHTNQPQLLAAEMSSCNHQQSENHASDRYLPSRGDSFPVLSSPALSQSLSLNQHLFISSPIGAQAPASPIASRLPKVMPSGDGRAGFIVLPAAAHADAVAVVSTHIVSHTTATGSHAHSTVPSLTRPDQGQVSAGKRISESDGSDAETQDSSVCDTGQEETLVIPETPTGTPIQPNSMRADDADTSGAGCKRPRPQPIRLPVADSEDSSQFKSRGQSSSCRSAVALTSASSGKARRNAVYSKIVALPTQPAARSATSSVRMSSRGRTIRPKVNFDSVTHRISSADIPELPGRRSRLEQETAAAALSASANESRNSFSGVRDNEDDVPLVCPTTLESQLQSKPVHDATVPVHQPASVKRVRPRNQMTPIQVENHENSVRVRGQDAGEAVPAPVIPLVELRRMSFIVTNVSSENTVDINKGQLDRTGTSKKVLVARATTLGMTAWTSVANVTSSAVLASSCPLPPHLVVMCETVVSASTQMLVALALGITPLHCSWLGSCSFADTNVAVISESFVLPLDAIIPKEYSRFANSRARPVCVTPLPIDLRVLSGRRLGYHARGASAARIATVLSFAGAVLIAVDSSVSAHEGCDYIIVESKDEAIALGGKHVPFDWVIAVLCIGYVQPLSLSLVSTSQAQASVPLRSSRFTVKRSDVTETVVAKATPSASKLSRSTDLSPVHFSRSGIKCRSNEAGHCDLQLTSPKTSCTRSPVSPSDKAALKILGDTNKVKTAHSAQFAEHDGSRSALRAGAASLIPPCFTLFDPKTKAYVRFDESGTVTSKVYSKDPSSNCELHAVESEQHGPYPHRLQCVHKSFLCVGRDGSVGLAGKGAGGRNLFKFAQIVGTRKHSCTHSTYEIIHESGRYLSLNASGAVLTKENSADATKWRLQPFDRNKKAR